MALNSLQGLPTEVVEVLLNLCDALDILHLLLVSSRLRKRVNQSIICFSIELEEEHHFRWPQWLSKLSRLRSLSISASELVKTASNRGFLFIPNVEISIIPKTLTELNLGSCAITENSKSPIPAFNRLVPQLRILTMKASRLFNAEKFVLVLPRQLEVLKIDFSNWCDFPPLFDYKTTMPPCLHTLEWSVSSPTNNELVQFPESLTWLKVDVSWSRGLTVPSWPPLLTHLHVPTCWMEDLNILNLPYLTSLGTVPLEAQKLKEVWELEKLAHVSVEPSRYFMPLIPQERYILRSIPSTLTSLNWNNCRIKEDFTFDCLPKNLTFLGAIGCEFAPNSNIAYLPRGLKHLELFKLDEHSIGLLPPGLSILRADFMILGHTRLPSTLTELTVQNWSLVDLSVLSLLPHGLKTLKRTNEWWHMGWKIPEGLPSEQPKLPSSLTTVVLNGALPINLLVQNLPASLSRLKIHQLQKHSALDLLHLLGHLPSNLRRLSFSNPGLVTADHFKALPRRLLSMKLDCKIQIDRPDEWRFLPRSLVSFTTTSNLGNIKAILPHLPPSLVMMKFDQGQIISRNSSVMLAHSRALEASTCPSTYHGQSNNLWNF